MACFWLWSGMNRAVRECDFDGGIESQHTTGSGEEDCAEQGVN